METRASSESDSERGVPPGTVSAAVEEHLRQLCLREFPCGTGSWNKSRFLPQTWRTWKKLVPREEETAGAGEESVEALLGLVRSHHSPWALLKDSSTEDRFLRELAIQSPLMIKDSFFYSYFRSLRVVDKGVSLVDRGLLKFLKLEELVLSANKIEEIDATNLPPTLKVLEIYGNLISSMKCLCSPPLPNLQHLGLGHNKLLGPLESLHITSNNWPNLVSLDLGFNDLTDLQGMMSGLCTLQHLRVLVLQGNPLALVPYYRGFTVDSLTRLCVLDDITVSPNEKHLFRGLRNSCDLLAREAQFVVTIGNLKGVVDSSIYDPEPGPEGPFITYNYYVTYDFVENEDAFVENEDAEKNEPATAPSEAPAGSTLITEIVQPLPSTEMTDDEAQGSVSEKVHYEVRQRLPRDALKEVAEEVAEDAAQESESTEMGDSESTVTSVHSAPLPPSINSAEELAKLRPRIDPRLCPSPGTVLFNTEHKPWADVIPCKYEKHHSLKDLVPLKAFLLAGTTVTIVEEKILSWSLAPPPVEAPSPAKKGKGEKEKKGKAEENKKEKDKKGKDKKGKDKKGKDKKGKDKGKVEEPKGLKKKELPKELRQDPPILHVLGSGRVYLEPLLAGEPLVSTVYNFGVIRALEAERLTRSRDLKKMKKTAKKERSKLSLPSYENVNQPEPLSVEIQIQLNQYRSAEEALRTLLD